jgi:hypothetical protein
VSYGQPTPEAVLAAFEAHHGISLPSSYRRYMATRGAGTPERNCYLDQLRNIEVYVGLILSFADETMAGQIFPFPPPIKSGFLTVANSGGGDYFLLELASGHVYYWDHEVDDVQFTAADLLWLANDFGDFVDALHPWPH